MSETKVTFLPEGTATIANPGETLMDVASYAGIDINNLCGGQGVCGKCRVRLMKGNVKSSSKSLGFLDRRQIEEHYILACQSEIVGEDVEVWIPITSRKGDEQILTIDHIQQIVDYDDHPGPVEDAPAPFKSIPYFRPLCRKYFLQLPKPSLTDTLSDLDRIYRELRRILNTSNLQTHFSCLWGLATLLRESDWQVTTTVHFRDADCPHIRAIESGDRTKRNYGVAVDVGTTTIVAQLIELPTGRIAGVEASHNRQAHYGEDVISRMIFACGRGGLGPLNEAVVTTINSLVDMLVAETGIFHDDITCYVAAGNTTMTHLLLDLEPCHIRVEPYIPTATRFPQFPTIEIGLKAHPRALLHCMPCVSSYVGGDITAGVLACGMSEQPRMSALIDVGTNGEIVVGNNEWLVCCSSSAGPAFEGGGVKCGMRATKGAIEKVRIDGNVVQFDVIADAPPLGICGSGLIDAIAELLTQGIIDQRGRFINLKHPGVRVVEEVPEFVFAQSEETEDGSGVVITEDDIGNLIKSKGAILAALKVILEDIGMSFSDLENIYVAGGFGAHLDIEKAIFIGLLPDVPRDRIRFIGNSSLAGARLGLLSAGAFHKAESIAGRMTYFELSVHPEFMNEFVASLFLPHTQMELFPSVKESLDRRLKPQLLANPQAR